MSAVIISWEEFQQEAIEFQKVAESLGDSWNLYKKDGEEYNAYLIYEQKILSTIDRTHSADHFEDSSCHFENENLVAVKPTPELLKVEYHVVYSMSYQVPVLYFRIYRNDGSLVSLEDTWRIFRIGKDVADSRTDGDMLSIMTQMDHPVLGKPYIAIHPCRTAELLGQAGISRNRVLTFISLMGPYVQLILKNEYGKAFTES